MENLYVYTSIYTLNLKFISFLLLLLFISNSTVMTETTVTTMAGHKTRDGIKLSKIVKMLEQLQGVEIRSGTKHPFIATSDGARPCPIATSTDAKRMLTPWVADVTGMTKATVYSSLKDGTWYN